ncbi:hypothetical protein CDD83_9326 [Cordyceps sp. RAO-2017]|nr:hypothetical protein CDD83_9326 [Cordyceps sp. RAO-2017]
MAPIFANQSCDPFQPRSSPCTLGNYVRYAVDARSPRDIAATLAFARKHDIRFVIRNTGHDFSGRSTGAGALAVWTHRFKDTRILDWNDGHYVGKALKVGSGVLGHEALEAARRAGLIIVSGACATVGLAGGYIQGGGHSPLTASYGLAADNTLSFDVVLPSGRLVTASRSENRDLYWALSGGGGGTYGVVTSVTVRAHPDAVVAGGTFSIEAPRNNRSQIYDILDDFHAALTRMVDADGFVFYSVNQGSLQSLGTTYYNKTKAQVRAVTQPFLDLAASRGFAVNFTYTEFPNYFDHYIHYLGPLPEGVFPVGTTLQGGRLIPRSVVPRLSPAVRKIVEMGVTFNGFGINVARFGRDGANAVLPRWRDAMISSVLMFPYDFQKPVRDMWALQDKLTRQVQPVIEAATPGGGAYMNEADFQQPDFQRTFYGSNYGKLLAIKRRYDPEGLLYGKTNVGSEDWEVDEGGRLCRAGGGEHRGDF